jgi:hypothetical protein
MLGVLVWGVLGAPFGALYAEALWARLAHRERAGRAWFGACLAAASLVVTIVLHALAFAPGWLLGFALGVGRRVRCEGVAT